MQTVATVLSQRVFENNSILIQRRNQRSTCPLRTSTTLPGTLQWSPVCVDVTTSAPLLHKCPKLPPPRQQVAVSSWWHLKAAHCVLSCCCKITSAIMSEYALRKEQRRKQRWKWSSKLLKVPVQCHTKG